MENQTENLCKECCRCLRFDLYYTKGVKRFNKTKCGLCTEKQSVVGNHESCDKFVRRYRYPRSSRLLKNYLNNLLTEITAVRQILEDQDNASDK